ncbi:MAG: hypothetical protein KF773_08465 [Deltaproteobacteria bacterium]|nr:hypothetical protein [Deltaproteobacteria bacterium]
MPSRLSSLLVRDGLVGVKRMEKAFQRQVIYGGSLDTILLEMSLVPEERLTQYLALASGLPPAARDEGSQRDTVLVGVITQELAERYRAVPVALEGEAVRVLVCSPLEIAELEDLADLLDRPLQPLITPEYRWHLVYAATYGLDPPARFTTLARSLDVDPASTPVGRARTIIVDANTPALPLAAGDFSDRAPSPAYAAPPLAAEVPTAPLVSPDADRLLEEARQRRQTLIGVNPNRASAAMPAVQAPPTPATPARRDGVPEEPVTRPIVTFLRPQPSGPIAIPTHTPDEASDRSAGRRTPPAVAVNTPSTGIPRAITEGASSKRVGARAAKRPPTQPISTEGRDSPIPIVRARELLATAEDRDTVFLTLLRAARSRARWAGLLTVQGGAAIGRVALAEPGLDALAVSTVLIPLDAVSPFRTVVSNHQAHIGPLTSGDPGIDAMVLRMGGTMPPSALILPIILRERVVALVVGHRVHSDIRLADVTELLPMATAASDALGRLIVRHKAAGYRAPAAAPVVEFEAEAIATKRLSRPDFPEVYEVSDDGESWRAPSTDTGYAPLPEPEEERAGEEDDERVAPEARRPTRHIDEVLSAIEEARESESEVDIGEALDRFGDTLSALMRRFPGKLRIDRFAIAGRALRAAQYGGLLELVIRLGPVASELLIEKMSAPQRDVRFYATVCVAELRPRTAVFALAERLFDQDFGVRACAIEALAGYPLQDLGHALVRARRAVHSNDAEVVIAATTAIVALGDIEAIADLIGVIERGDRGGEHARKALVALTAQDFGPSEKKWRKWWETARPRHRIEWLIEGLGHKEDAIRESAINDLRRLTGEYFGYHHDLPRREREAAAERWVRWWRDAGRTRFATPENERHRPTALLPIRRD